MTKILSPQMSDLSPQVQKLVKNYQDAFLKKNERKMLDELPKRMALDRFQDYCRPNDIELKSSSDVAHYSNW